MKQVGNRKVYRDTIDKMQSLRDGGMTVKKIAEKFNVAPSTVHTYTIGPRLRERMNKGWTPGTIYAARIKYKMTWPKICETYKISKSWAQVLYKRYKKEIEE